MFTGAVPNAEKEIFSIVARNSSTLALMGPVPFPSGFISTWIFCSRSSSENNQALLLKCKSYKITTDICIHFMITNFQNMPIYHTVKCNYNMVFKRDLLFFTGKYLLIYL